MLLLTHRLPYAPNKGDRLRAFHLLRALRPWAEVDLLSLVHSADEAAHTPALDGLAAQVTTVRVPRWRNRVRAVAALAGPTPLTHVLFDAHGLEDAVRRLVADRQPDVVLAFCSGMARLALLPGVSDRPLIVDLVDVDSAKWRDLAAVTPPPLKWIYAREARTLARFETHVAARAQASTVVNDRERDELRRLAPHAAVRVVPNGVDLDAFQSPHPPSAEPHVIFTGVMDYPPNEQAVLWMAAEVWPRVLRRRPDARFSVVGANPGGRVRGLARSGQAITVTGTVPAVQPYLWSAAVAVAPLRTARGVQNKALEALAAGLPCVVTPDVADGLPPRALAGCRVAADPEAFADAITELLAETPMFRRHLAAEAQVDALAWATQLAPLIRLVASAADTQPARLEVA